MKAERLHVLQVSELCWRDEHHSFKNVRLSGVLMMVVESPVEHLQNLLVEICGLRPYDSHYFHPPQTWMHLLLCSSTHSVWFFHLQPVRNVYSLNIIKNSILILLHLNTCFTFVLTYVAAASTPAYGAAAGGSLG